MFDVGICEQHAVTFSAGLATQASNRFAIYSTFLQRGYDQLIHDVCLQNLPVVFAIDRAGAGRGQSDAAGAFDLSFLETCAGYQVARRETTSIRGDASLGAYTAGLRHPVRAQQGANNRGQRRRDIRGGEVLARARTPR